MRTGHRIGHSGTHAVCLHEQRPAAPLVTDSSAESKAGSKTAEINVTFAVFTKEIERPGGRKLELCFGRGRVRNTALAAPVARHGRWLGSGCPA